MNRKRLVRKMEVKFWDIVTPLMDENGPILKTKQALKKTLHTKAGFLGFAHSGLERCRLHSRYGHRKNDQPFPWLD